MDERPPGRRKPLLIAGVSRTELRLVAGPDGVTDLILAEVTYPPGTTAPPHRPPVGGLVYILEGQAESAYGDDAPQQHGAGATLLDEAGQVHTVFRNCDSERPLRFLTFYAITPGEDYATEL